MFVTGTVSGTAVATISLAGGGIVTDIKTALVTGANRGIGLEICRQLVAQGIRVLLSARSYEKAQQAIINKFDKKLENNNLINQDLIRPLELDVCNQTHLENLKSQLQTGALNIDILVNNAGVSKGISYNILTEPRPLTQETLDINFWGALSLCQTVIPFMQQKNYGRVVNVSSGHGSFSKIDQQNPGYRLSKVNMNAMTVMLADAVKEQNILVNAMTPGWVRTRLGGVNAQRSLSQGAETAVWLCLLDDHGPRGQFFKDKQVFPW